MSEKPKEPSRLRGTLIDKKPADETVSRLSGDLIEKLRKTKVSSLEELKDVCKVGSKLKSENYIYEIFEIKGELVRAKQTDTKSGFNATRNFTFPEMWTYFQEGRLAFAD